MEPRPSGSGQTRKLRFRKSVTIEMWSYTGTRQQVELAVRVPAADIPTAKRLLQGLIVDPSKGVVYPLPFPKSGDERSSELGPDVQQRRSLPQASAIFHADGETPIVVSIAHTPTSCLRRVISAVREIHHQPDRQPHEKPDPRQQRQSHHQDHAARDRQDRH